VARNTSDIAACRLCRADVVSLRLCEVRALAYMLTAAKVMAKGPVREPVALKNGARTRHANGPVSNEGQGDPSGHSAPALSGTDNGI
jgi:hypothetical protein